MAANEPVDVDLSLVKAQEGDFAVLLLTPHPGWHAYANTPGSSGFPTRVEARLGDTLLAPLYPPGESKPDPLSPGGTARLYSGPTPIFLPLPANQGELVVTIHALLCSASTCQPIRQTLRTTIDAAAWAAASPAETRPWWPQLRKAHPEASTLPSALAPQTSPPTEAAPAFAVRVFDPGLEVRSLAKAMPLAFLAGIILNIMPCVLPVIGLKLRGMLPATVDQCSISAFRSHNLAFAAGIISFFGFLALLIGATGMAWGQIFQSPTAVTALTAVVMLLALSLFGLLDLPLIDLKAKPQTSTGPLHAFTTGLLATLLATPCSGPFLGGVLAWALLQPPLIIIAVLLCVGVGMSTPYLVLAAAPALVCYFPRPGAWMGYLETGLGFFLSGTAIYLLGLLPEAQLFPTLIFLWVLALSAWIWGRWASLSQPPLIRLIWRTVATALVVLGIWGFLIPDTQPDPWQPFDRQRFEELRHTTPLLLDFTADWCPNCKFLEKTVLTPKASARIAQRYAAVLIRVDLTHEDAERMALLSALGARSIPLVAIFSPHRPNAPLILRDLFTATTLERALAEEWGPSQRSQPQD